jgi:hypothetical protein
MSKSSIIKAGPIFFAKHLLLEKKILIRGGGGGSNSITPRQILCTKFITIGLLSKGLNAVPLGRESSTLPLDHEFPLLCFAGLY